MLFTLVYLQPLEYTTPIISFTVDSQIEQKKNEDATARAVDPANTHTNAHRARYFQYSASP